MPRSKRSRPQTLEETVYRLYREQYKREYNRNRYKSTTWTVPLRKGDVYDFVSMKKGFYGDLDARAVATSLLENSRYLDRTQMDMAAGFYADGMNQGQITDALYEARQTLTNRNDARGLAMLGEWEATHPMPTDRESFMEWFRDAPLVLKKKLVNGYLSAVGNDDLQYVGEGTLSI